MLSRVALVRTDVSEELSASIIKVTIIGELGITLAVTNNRSTLRRNTIVFLRSVRQFELGTTLAVTNNRHTLRRNTILCLCSVRR
jgi:hypothetical protein